MRGRWFGSLLPALTVMICAMTSTASGHPLFMTFIEHRNYLTVGAKNIDIRIELTFFEMRSQIERRRMDGDGDGTIRPAEVEAYLKSLTEQTDRGVTLLIDGREVEVYPMYGPALDLLGVDQIAPVHHRLTLTYFARIPEWIKTGSQIELIDRLWAGVSAVPHFIADSRDGFRLEAGELPTDNPASPLTFVAGVRQTASTTPSNENQQEVDRRGKIDDAENTLPQTTTSPKSNDTEPGRMRAVVVERDLSSWNLLATVLIVFVFALLIMAAVAIWYRKKPPQTGG